MDNEKAIRAAKLTLGGILEKRRAKTAVERAQGQIAPSKYLPDVPRQVHANGGYVPSASLPIPRLAVASPLAVGQQPGLLDVLGTLNKVAGSARTLSDLVRPEKEEPAREPHAERVEAKAEGLTPEASAAMEALRKGWAGQDFGIVSGYRDPEHNERVGGAKDSQHTHGNAYDVNTTGWSPEDKLALADAAWNAGFRGFGFYDNNMHFDVAGPRAWGPSHSRDSIPDWAQGWAQERYGYAEGGEVTDLGQVREQKQLQGYHTGMMDDIHQRMSNAMEAHEKAVGQGVFDGYEVGDTLQGSAHPMRITGRYMQKWKPTSMAMRSFERMGTEPTIIEHEGEQYIPMLRYETGKEGVDGFQQGSAYLDGVKAAGYQKMGGLRAVKARGGAVGFDKWFEGSKVRHPDGSPMQMVHATQSADIKAFRPSSEGIWFSPKHDTTSADEVATIDHARKGYVNSTDPDREPSFARDATYYPVHLSIKNPAVGDLADDFYSGKETVQSLKKKGYDGVKYHDDVHVAFEPNQIKSVFNRSAHTDDPDIMKADGGSVSAKESFLAGNHHDVPDVLYHGNAPRVATKGWMEEVDEEQTQKNRDAMDFKEFKPSGHGKYGPGIYLTDNPAAASGYAQGIRADQRNPKMYGQVMKLHASIKQPFTEETLRIPAWRDYIKNALSDYISPHRKEDLAHRQMLFQKLDDGTATLNDLFLREVPEGHLINDWGQYDIHDTIRRSGFDGIIAKSPAGVKEYVAFKPEQVKSALSARKFDPTSPDMTYADGGAVDDDGIDAYHGSPHDFDGFDISKIGTGEGNQSYGYGLYFAGKEGVAKSYRDALSDTLIHPEGTPGLEKRAGQMALTFSDNTPEGAISWLSKFKNGATHTSPAMTPELVDAVSKRFSSGEFRPGGHMYKVKLAVQPHELVEWDKPLSEQHPNVQAVLGTGSETAAAKLNRANNNPMHAGDIVGRDRATPKELSEHLLSKGIKGIRYRDAGSRDTSDGDLTHNYVMFHHDPVKVVNKYEYGGAVGRADGGKVVYQGRSKKGIQQFFNPNGHAWGTTDLDTAKLFAGQSETTYPNATPRRAETSYNGEVHKLRFNIKNPMRVDIKETLWDASKEKAKIEEAKAKGHDGLEIYHNPNKSDFVAFSPDQVEHLGSSTPETTVDHYADGGAVYTPQKTVKAYKLFRTKGDGKLYPLFVNADKPVPMGEWLEAEEGPQGKAEGKVKSKLGDLAYRPGWHAGDLPMATHIGGKSDPSLKKPDYRPDNHVWAEVEMAADKDWQSVADSRGKGVKAHITDQVPYGGFYRYKTNPNMTGNWLIGGHMKVNRVLPDEEVRAINDAAGTADLPRRSEGFAAGGAAMFEGIHEDLQDEQGNPLELWHGTPGEGFSEFKDEKLGSTRDYGFYGRGHYLTPDQENASEYAGSHADEGTLMGPLHAALKNPYIWDASEQGAHRTLRDLQSMGIMKGQDRLEAWDNLQRHHIDPFMREMQKRGHDGVIVRTNDYTGEKPHKVSEIVVFKPSAIKHKDAERFDPNDPNIYHARGGVAK